MSYENIFRLDGKVALLPGGAGGIGAAMARAMVEYGADVIIAGRSLEKAQATGDSLMGVGKSALASAVDVVDPESVDRIGRQEMERCGRLDILGNVPWKLF